MASYSFNTISINRSLISTSPNKFYLDSNTDGSGKTLYPALFEYQSPDGVIGSVNFSLRPYVYLKISNNAIVLTRFGYDLQIDGKLPKSSDFLIFYSPSPVTSSNIPSDGDIRTVKTEDSLNVEISGNGMTTVTASYKPKIKTMAVNSHMSGWYTEFIDVEIPAGGVTISNNVSTNIAVRSINVAPAYIDMQMTNGRLIDTLSVLVNELFKYSTDTENDRLIVKFDIRDDTPITQKVPVYFYDYTESNSIGSGNVDVGTYDIDAIASLIGVSPIQQTKPSAKKNATTYNVNFYVDSSLTSKTGNSQTVKGGESTITYSHKEDPDTRHFYWKNGKNGDEAFRITLKKDITYKFYPVFVESVTEATLPTNLPTNGFYGKERIGYRAENGSRTNNTYYAKNGNQVERGGGITQDMISGTNIDLYLKWIPVKYTIRFNKGNADGWANPTNILGTITKTYGESISTSDSCYPTQFTRLLLNGYLQRGWVNNGSSVYSDGDNSICTYSYSGDYAFTKQPITDKWYNDNMSGVDVYPSWYPVNHKVLAHYYTTKGGTEKLDTYNFNIGSAHLSINEPKELDDKSSTWVFLGWAQITKPKGDGWEWGSGGTDIRNYGAFRYITDLKDIQYFRSYGVNSKSLTKEDWDNTSKNLDIYALWSINSRYVFVGNAWRPTTGIWVYIDGAWRSVDSIYYQSSNLPTTATWKQEIVE